MDANEHRTKWFIRLLHARCCRGSGDCRALKKARTTLDNGTAHRATNSSVGPSLYWRHAENCRWPRGVTRGLTTSIRRQDPTLIELRRKETAESCRCAMYVRISHENGYASHSHTSRVQTAVLHGTERRVTQMRRDRQTASIYSGLWSWRRTSTVAPRPRTWLFVALRTRYTDDETTRSGSYQ